MSSKETAIGFALVSVMSFVSGAVAADLGHHPHLRAARNKCEKAIQDLKEANNGKFEFGGHRDNARICSIRRFRKSTLRLTTRTRTRDIDWILAKDFMKSKSSGAGMAFRKRSGPKPH